MISKKKSCTDQAKKQAIPHEKVVTSGISEFTSEDMKKCTVDNWKHQGFFDEWSPEMAWCLGVFYERGVVDESYSSSVYSSNFRLLGEMRRLVKDSRFLPDRRELRIDSPKTGLRLIELGMSSNQAYDVTKVPEIPPEYERYLIRGIMDENRSLPFSDTLTNLWVEISTSRKAVARYVEKVLTRRGYDVKRGLTDIEFSGIIGKEPAAYSYAVRVRGLQSVIDLYEWLYSKDASGIRYNEAQKWFWHYLKWLSDEIDAAKTLLNRIGDMKRLGRAVKAKPKTHRTAIG